MKSFKIYKEQNKLAQKLLDSIRIKCTKFANQQHDSMYYEDLLHVISELKHLETFLK